MSSPTDRDEVDDVIAEARAFQWQARRRWSSPLQAARRRPRHQQQQPQRLYPSSAIVASVPVPNARDQWDKAPVATGPPVPHHHLTNDPSSSRRRRQKPHEHHQQSLFATSPPSNIRNRILPSSGAWRETPRTSNERYSRLSRYSNPPPPQQQYPPVQVNNSSRRHNYNSFANSAPSSVHQSPSVSSVHGSQSRGSDYNRVPSNSSSSSTFANHSALSVHHTPSVSLVHSSQSSRSDYPRSLLRRRGSQPNVSHPNHFVDARIDREFDMLSMSRSDPQHPANPADRPYDHDFSRRRPSNSSHRPTMRPMPAVRTNNHHHEEERGNPAMVDQRSYHDLSRRRHNSPQPRTSTTRPTTTLISAANHRHQHPLPPHHHPQSDPTQEHPPTTRLMNEADTDHHPQSDLPPNPEEPDRYSITLAAQPPSRHKRNSDSSNEEKIEIGYTTSSSHSSSGSDKKKAALVAGAVGAHHVGGGDNTNNDLSISTSSSSSSTHNSRKQLAVAKQPESLGIFQSNGRTLVEVQPGMYLTLRGRQETIDALQAGFTTDSLCMNCAVDLTCIRDCQYVICPDCRIVSPIDNPIAGSSGGGDGFQGGLGLGVKTRTYSAS